MFNGNKKKLKKSTPIDFAKEYMRNELSKLKEKDGTKENMAKLYQKVFRLNNDIVKYVPTEYLSEDMCIYEFNKFGTRSRWIESGLCLTEKFWINMVSKDIKNLWVCEKKSGLGKLSVFHRNKRYVPKIMMKNSCRLFHFGYFFRRRST